MAKSGEEQQNSSAASRVFKTKDVHKRRAVRLESLPKIEQGDGEDRESDVDAGETRAVASAASANRIPGGGRPSEDVRDADGGDGGKDGSPDVPDASEGYDDAGEIGVEGAVDDSKADDGSDGTEGAEGSPDASEDALGDDLEGPYEEEEPIRPQRKRRIRVRHVLAALVIILILAAVVFCSVFAWNRWGRYDDHADMQGEWYVLGTTTPVTIDERVIHLNDEISYEYTIDDRDKTIEFTFGPMEGKGRYWFSDDRNYLAIIDGEGFTGVGNAIDDLVRTFTVKPGATGARIPKGEGVIAFAKEPSKLSAKMKEAAERARDREEKRIAAEQAEAERKAEEEAQAQAEAEAAAAEESGYYY